MSDPVKLRKRDEQRESDVGAWIIFIFLAAIGFSVIREVIIGMAFPTREWSASDLGATTGNMVGIIVVPGIVAMIWWGTRKFDRARARGPLIAWATLTALMGLGSIHAAWREVGPPEFATYLYQPTNCEFSIRFPGQPRKVEPGDILPSNFILANEMSFRTKRSPTSLLQAGCTMWDKGQFKNEEELSSVLIDLADHHDLQDIETSRVIADGVVIITTRGIRQIESGNSEAEFRWYVGNHSLLAVTTTGLARDYPSMVVTRFHNSVMRPEDVE